jgi:acetyl-CoA synthetase
MSGEGSEYDVRSPELKRMLRLGAERPEELWGSVAEELNWFEPWDAVYEEEGPGEFRWFPGGTTNMSYNCLDYHVEQGRGNRAALVYETGERDVTRVVTYKQLLEDVKEFAATLRSFGVEEGDRVTIYLPMCPEAIVAMLATTRIGAIHSVVFGGFGAGALADRIDLAESELLLTADVGYRGGKEVDLKAIVDDALDNYEDAEGIEDVIVLQRGDDPDLRDRDTRWRDAVAAADADGGYVERGATDPAFILPTSGTTGRPKGTVHTHGGYQVHVYAMAKWMFGIEPEDVWYATSDIGWIVGHSYIVYAPLLRGCSTVVYEGTPDHPDPGVWWDLVERDGISKIFTAPTAIRALSGHDDAYHERADLSSLEAVFSAGEPLNPPAWRWLQKDVLDDEVPVVDHMWQTETGGPIIGNPYGIDLLPIKPGSAGIPLPGIQADIRDFDGEPVDPGEEGALVIEEPFPGLTPTLWEGEDRYRREYWQEVEGVYWAGDAATKDEDGYFWFSGRADEVITIAGHRIGPTDIEDALVSHDAVVEAAAIGKPDPEKTEVASTFVVLGGDYEPSDDLAAELEARIRDVVGPIAVVDDVVFVEQLPKTRSGKIMRRTISDIMLDNDLGDVSTMEDESAVDEIDAATEEIEVPAPEE